MALNLDRKAFVDILTEGQGYLGGVLQPPPGGFPAVRNTSRDRLSWVETHQISARDK